MSGRMTITSGVEMTAAILSMTLPDGRHVTLHSSGFVEVADKPGGLNRYVLSLPDVAKVADDCGMRCQEDDDPGVSITVYHKP